MNKKQKVGKLLQPIPLDFETVVRALAATKPPPKPAKKKTAAKPRQ